MKNRLTRFHPDAVIEFPGLRLIREQVTETRHRRNVEIVANRKAQRLSAVLGQKCNFEPQVHFADS